MTTETASSTAVAASAPSSTSTRGAPAEPLIDFRNDIEGILLVKSSSDLVQISRKRFVCVKGTVLCVYNSERDSQGTFIPLNQAKISFGGSDGQDRTCFVITLGDQEFTFTAPNGPEQLTQWLRVIDGNRGPVSEFEDVSILSYSKYVMKPRRYDRAVSNDKEDLAPVPEEDDEGSEEAPPRVREGGEDTTGAATESGAEQ